MTKVIVNEHEIDGAIVNFVSNDDIRIDLMHSTEYSDGNFLQDLSHHPTVRRMVSVKIIDGKKVINAYVKVIGIAPEFSDKVKFVAKCECLPTYDRHGNKNGVQYSIECL